MHRQLAFPCVRLIGALGFFLEAGNRIGCVAVVDTVQGRVLVIGRGDESGDDLQSDLGIGSSGIIHGCQKVYNKMVLFD